MDGSRLIWVEDVFSIMMGYRLDSQSSIPGCSRIFLFSIASRLALVLSQPPIQWVLVVKRQDNEADHSPPSSAEVKNVGANIYYPICFN
jgi:hypothetical protein